MSGARLVIEFGEKDLWCYNWSTTGTFYVILSNIIRQSDKRNYKMLQPWKWSLNMMPPWLPKRLWHVFILYVVLTCIHIKILYVLGPVLIVDNSIIRNKVIELVIRYSFDRLLSSKYLDYLEYSGGTWIWYFM